MRKLFTMPVALAAAFAFGVLTTYAVAQGTSRFPAYRLPINVTYQNSISCAANTVSLTTFAVTNGQVTHC